jgi:chromosome segregation ATPase
VEWAKLTVLVLIFFELMWIAFILHESTIHLLKELKEIREELNWSKDKNFADRLFTEIKENFENLKGESTEMNQSLNQIDATLNDLKEMALEQRVKDGVS